MPGYVLVIDVFGAILGFFGFTMAFRQPAFRRFIGRPQPPPSRTGSQGDEDPLTYVLRISGVMVMVFGIVLAGMVTLVHLA